MAKTLGELASEYAQKEFPVYPEKDDIRNIGKHDVAFHAFADGWNAARRESPWISVEEDLPCNHEELKHLGNTNNVLVIDDKQSTFIAFMKKYKDNEWIWDSTNNFVFLPLITHWMPIPEFIDNI